MAMPERMKKLYQRLKDIGIPTSYARSVALPAGWDDNATSNPAVYSQALGLLARNLNLSLRSLQNDEAPIEWDNCGPTLFKRNANISDDDLNIARCLAVRAAQTACEGMQTPVATIPESGAAIRESILKQGYPHVDFDNLLKYCWDNGIPVLYITNLPRTALKPDALACIFDEDQRPAIILVKKRKYGSQLLFTLAHELGHIAKKHLATNDILLDNDIDSDSTELQEAEANAFAIELITGHPGTRYHAQANLTGEALARQARLMGERDGISPGFIALSYANAKQKENGNGIAYAVASIALNIIEQDSDPIVPLHRYMRERLDWNSIGRDSRPFLRSITGLNSR